MISTKAVKLLYLNLISQSAIILTGAIVRLTGSGLGCPTWPRCAPGSFTPTASQAEGFHKWIEFGNRLLTFVLAAIAIAVLVYGIRKFRQHKMLLLLSIAPVVGTAFQAILGGITVLTKLNPLTVMAHFLVSIFLVALAVALIWKAQNPSPSQPTEKISAPGHYLLKTLIGVGLLVIILGTITTGSGPHSGDTEAARFNLDLTSIVRLHADVVWLFMGLLIGSLVLVKVLKIKNSLTNNLYFVLALSLTQGLIGYGQWFSGLPWVLVAVHVGLAVLLWIFLVRVLFSARESIENRLS